MESIIKIIAMISWCKCFYKEIAAKENGDFITEFRYALMSISLLVIALN